MEKIDTKQLVDFMSGYLGKQVEIGISPLWVVNTNNSFNWVNTDEVLTLYDNGKDGIRTRQEILIEKDQIVEILLTKGETIYDSVVSIELVNGKIDFCIGTKPVKCFKCKKVIDVPYETKWSIQGVGGYGSRFENEKLDVPICDNCLYFDIFGYKDGQFDE